MKSQVEEGSARALKRKRRKEKRWRSDSGESREPAPRPVCFRLNETGDREDDARTILITGTARSGTSFAASVAARLGVPFRCGPEDQVSGHWEHRRLREAFQSREDALFRETVAAFDAAHPVWGWKLPRMRQDLAWVVERVRNARFIFTFKEPISVAQRKVQRGQRADFHASFESVLGAYQALADFSRWTNRPVMLLSYDAALRQFDECVSGIAHFCGVEKYDAADVARGVAEDARRY